MSACKLKWKWNGILWENGLWSERAEGRRKTCSLKLTQTQTQTQTEDTAYTVLRGVVVVIIMLLRYVSIK